MQQIPIRINRKGSNQQQQVFKIFPLQNKIKIKHKRQNTYHSIEKPTYQSRKHDTLDPNKLHSEYRYRRISSSGGTHKFPKDFFNNNQLPKTPIRIRFSRSKKGSLIDSHTPTKINHPQPQTLDFKHHHMKYTLDSPQRNCQLINQVQTPKFNKDHQDQQFIDFKSKTTNKKIRLQDYLSHKKQNFPIFFKHTKDYYFQDQKPNDILGQLSQKFQEKLNSKNSKNSQPNQQAEKQKEILIQTLGQNNKIMKKVSISAKPRKRNISQMEKQNREDFIGYQKKNQKSIKAFLSTKGLNWKVIQKINQMKPKQGQDQCAITFNFKQPTKKKQQKQNINTRQKKGLSEVQDENQKNTFRIRKKQ